jgi:hypothetical protein
MKDTKKDNFKSPLRNSKVEIHRYIIKNPIAIFFEKLYPKICGKVFIFKSSNL